MELENVIKLINAVSESSLTSFSMEDGDTKLSLGADRSDRAAVKETAGADDIVNSDNGNESGLNKSDINDDFTLYIYSIKDGSYYYVDSSNISDMNLISEIRKELDNPFDKTFDTDKVILSVSYYDEDTYNNVKYYMQLSDYSTLKSLGY